MSEFRGAEEARATADHDSSAVNRIALPLALE